MWRGAISVSNQGGRNEISRSGSRESSECCGRKAPSAPQPSACSPHHLSVLEGILRRPAKRLISSIMASAQDLKLMKQTKFPPEFGQKVDMKKVNIEVMKKSVLPCPSTACTD